jgi:hypothetical protein
VGDGDRATLISAEAFGPFFRPALGLLGLLLSVILSLHFDPFNTSRAALETIPIYPNPNSDSSLGCGGFV